MLLVSTHRGERSRLTGPIPLFQTCGSISASTSSVGPWAAQRPLSMMTRRGPGERTSDICAWRTASARSTARRFAPDSQNPQPQRFVKRGQRLVHQQQARPAEQGRPAPRAGAGHRKARRAGVYSDRKSSTSTTWSKSISGPGPRGKAGGPGADWPPPTGAETTAGLAFTKPICRRSGARVTPRAVSHSGWPSSVIDPSSGVSNPHTSASAVLLPLPEGPHSAVTLATKFRRPDRVGLRWHNDGGSET